MARRRSARLAKEPPKAPSTPSQATRSLDSVVEQDENPAQHENPVDSASSHSGDLSSPPPRTPASSSIQPPMSEMHPSKARPAPSSALRLGFSDIKPSREAVWLAASPAPAGLASSAVPASPTKPTVPSSPFTFRFAGPGKDGGLSERAQRMMSELRGEAQKIKADLIAQREQDQLNAEAEQATRRIAQPKGRAGRFSAAHMAQFKKMDSIANHPSAFRAQATAPRPITPLTRGVKRTQSRANLDDAEPARASTRRGPHSAAPAVAAVAPELPRADSHKRSNPLFNNEPPSAVKRVRQHLNEDASSSRPVSRDGSFIPRPATAGKDVGGGLSAIPRSHSTLASLMTPTKASLAKAAPTKIPISGALANSPSKPAVGADGDAIKKSATMGNLNLATEQKQPAPVRSPGRFDRVKSILMGSKRGGVDAKRTKTALPMPSAASSRAVVAATPSNLGLDKPLPKVPVTTPSRKLTKRVVLTPEARQAALHQGTPSFPAKSGIPRSKSCKTLDDLPAAQVSYPSLEAVMGDSSDDPYIYDVTYPDLYKSTKESVGKSSTEQSTASSSIESEKDIAIPPPNAPGTFTFRSDHTIRFGGASPSGFGSTRGQASVRRVRPSSIAQVMPGSFPASIADLTSHAGATNKENCDPVTTAPKIAVPDVFFPAVKHGLPNKKRHRPSADEEDLERESAERAAKKRRQDPVPEGDALLAPRLMGLSAGGVARKAPSTPFKPPRTLSTNSSTKKKSTLSLSRLNMLARPKMRK